MFHLPAQHAPHIPAGQIYNPPKPTPGKHSIGWYMRKHAVIPHYVHLIDHFGIHS